MKVPEKRVLLGDVLLCAFVIALAAVVLVCGVFSSSRSGRVEIVSDSCKAEYSLFSDRVISVESNGHKLTVVIAEGAVCVSEADCPDEVCVKTGAVSRVGSSIICVPARVAVTVVGDSEVDYAIK